MWKTRFSSPRPNIELKTKNFTKRRSLSSLCETFLNRTSSKLNTKIGIRQTISFNSLFQVEFLRNYFCKRESLYTYIFPCSCRIAANIWTLSDTDHQALCKMQQICNTFCRYKLETFWECQGHCNTSHDHFLSGKCNLSLFPRRLYRYSIPDAEDSWWDGARLCKEDDLKSKISFTVKFVSIFVELTMIRFCLEGIVLLVVNYQNFRIFLIMSILS